MSSSLTFYLLGKGTGKKHIPHAEVLEYIIYGLHLEFIPSVLSPLKLSVPVSLFWEHLPAPCGFGICNFHITEPVNTNWKHHLVLRRRNSHVLQPRGKTGMGSIGLLRDGTSSAHPQGHASLSESVCGSCLNMLTWEPNLGVALPRRTQMFHRHLEVCVSDLTRSL